MDRYEADEDFGNEIQDLARIIQDASKPSFHKDNGTIMNLFTMLTRKEEDHDVDHYERGEKFIAVKVETPPQVEINQQFVVKKNQQSHWDLTYEPQTLINKNKNRIIKKQDDNENVQTCHLDIWEDALSMRLLTGGALVHDEHAEADIERTKKIMMHYYQQEDTLYFQNLMVPKLKDRSQIIKKMHNKIGHFGEGRTLSQIKQQFFQHDRTNFIKKIVNKLNKLVT